MNELQRMQYLDAMGVDSFVPRYILPVAKAPSQCDLPIAPAPQDPVVADEQKPSVVSQGAELQAPSTTAGAGQSSVKAAGPIAQNILAKVQTTEAPTPISVEQAPEADEAQSIEEKPLAPPVEFSLAMWRANDTIFIIDSRRKGDALPTQALLNNILQGIDLISTALPREEILNWPVIKGDHDQSWQAASQMVQGFLDARLLSKPVETFLLLGEDACRAVLGEAFDYQKEQYQSVKVEDYSAKGVVLPSLADILYSPELKREVWLALCELKSSGIQN